jgi:hypothetical protein
VQLKYKIVIAVCALAIAFASGRYSVSYNETTHEVTNTQDTKHKTEVVRTVVHTVTVQEPNGEIKTVTDSDTHTATKEDEQENQQVTLDQTKISTTSKLNISALAGIDTQSLAHPFVYGLSVSKQVIGPITAGLFGLNNGTIGVSVGLSF